MDFSSARNMEKCKVDNILLISINFECIFKIPWQTLTACLRVKIYYTLNYN